MSDPVPYDKPLTEMSFAELDAALYAAKQASQLAEYQDGLAAYREAKDAAEDRVRAVTEEIDRRLPTLSERRAAEHG